LSPGAFTDNSLSPAVIAAAAALLAVLLVGLGAVSRSLATGVFQEHHVSFTLVGSMVMVSAAIFFTLTFVAK